MSQLVKNGARAVWGEVGTNRRTKSTALLNPEKRKRDVARGEGGGKGERQSGRKSGQLKKLINMSQTPTVARKVRRKKQKKKGGVATAGPDLHQHNKRKRDPWTTDKLVAPARAGGRGGRWKREKRYGGQDA